MGANGLSKKPGFVKVAWGWDFFAFCSLGRVPEGSRTNFGGSGDLPDRIPGGFWSTWGPLERIMVGQCRVEKHKVTIIGLFSVLAKSPNIVSLYFTTQNCYF